MADAVPGHQGQRALRENGCRRAASLPIVHRRRGTRTLQEQIYRGIRQSILDGLVGADRRLPSTRSLAADLGVSRTTALLALEQLRAEGYVVARRGFGHVHRAAAARSARPPPVTAARATRRASAVLAARPAAVAHAARRTGDRRRRRARSGSARRRSTCFPGALWSQITRECLRDAASPRSSTTRSSRGCAHLREAIAEQVQSRGTRCDADQVQVVTGAQRGLDLIAHMLLDPGDAA